MRSFFVPVQHSQGDLMYSPTRAEFKALAEKGNLVPVYREMNADLETPASVYLKLRGRRESFLLESVEGGEQLARYSFIAVDPSRVFILQGDEALLRDRSSQVIARRTGGDPLDDLRAVMQQYHSVPVPGLPRFFGGAVGFLSYDMVRHFERVRTFSLSLPHKEEEGSGNASPDAVFLLTATLIASDNVKHRALIIANAGVEDDLNAAYDDAIQTIEEIVACLRQPLPAHDPHVPLHGQALRSNVTPAEFADQVRRAQEHIAAGDIFQAVLSQRFQRKTDAGAFSIYRALRRLNPSPYVFLLDLGDIQFIGSSSEAPWSFASGIRRRLSRMRASSYQK
jgi:anthranilate synthase component 1